MLFNWHEVPFIRICLPLLIGLALGLYLQINLFLILSIAVLLILVFTMMMFKRMAFTNRWISGMIANISLFILGIGLTNVHNALLRPGHFANYGMEEGIFIGDIVGEIRVKSRIRCIVDVKMAGDFEGKLHASSGKMQVYLQADSKKGIPKYGDRLAFTSRINEVRSPTNPGEFDYQNYLKRKNIHFQAFPDSSSWQFVSRNGGLYILRKSSQMREYFLSKIRQYIPNIREQGVAGALLLGYKSDVSEETLDAYRDSGAAHVLAVSGLHVGLVFMLLHWLFKAFDNISFFKKFLRPILLLAAIWFYAFLTGSSPSVLRAATMFSFLIIGKSINRNNNIFNSLAASAVLLLLVNPYLITEVGFQLSYLAVAGIVIIHPIVNSMLHFRFELGNRIWELISVGIAAQIVTFPLVLYYFHQFPMMFWLSGILVIVASGLILPIGWLMLLSSWWPGIGEIPAFILKWLLMGMNEGILLISSIPGSTIKSIWIQPFGMVLLYIFVASLCLFLIFGNRKWVFAGLSAILLFFAQEAFHQISDFSKNRLTIYNIPGKFALDFFHGDEVFSISDEEVSKSDYEFRIEGNRGTNHIRKEESINAESAEMLIRNPVYRKGSFIQLGKTRLGISGLKEHPLSGNVKTEHIIVIADIEEHLENIINRNNPSIIILTGGFPQWKARKWVAMGDSLNIKIHSTMIDGAFQTTL